MHFLDVESRAAGTDSTTGNEGTYALAVWGYYVATLFVDRMLPYLYMASAKSPAQRLVTIRFIRVLRQRLDLGRTQFDHKILTILLMGLDTVMN